MRDNNKIKFFIFTFLSFSLIILLAACKKDENVINNDEPLPKWKNIEIGFNNNYKSIFFINEFTGYAVGNSYPNDSSKIIKTTNGGQNWFTSFTAVTSVNLAAIFFVNLNTGFAAGNEETIIKTTNGGDDWFLSNFNGINPITCIAFFDENNGIASGYNSLMLRTANGGASWQSVPLITQGNLYSFSILNNQGEAFTSGDVGLIYYTDNFGNNWQRQNYDPNIQFRSIFFPDQNTGYSSGKDGVIFKTTNKGNNWVRQTNNLTIEFSSLYFTDVNTGYFTSDQGLIYKTKDGCVSLFRSLTETQNYLRKVVFTGVNKGFAAGESGTIIYTDTGGE